MTYVLDTNIVSALLKGRSEVLARLQQVARRDVCMPHPVVAEIEYGLRRLARSKRREVLESRFALLKSEIRRCEWSDAVSEAFGKIKSTLERKGMGIEDFDAAVAAHALALGGVLVTTNLKHMVRVSGLHIEDWAQPLGV